MLIQVYISICLCVCRLLSLCSYMMHPLFHCPDLLQWRCRCFSPHPPPPSHFCLECGNQFVCLWNVWFSCSSRLGPCCYSNCMLTKCQLKWITQRSVHGINRVSQVIGGTCGVRRAHFSVLMKANKGGDEPSGTFALACTCKDILKFHLWGL